MRRSRRLTALALPAVLTGATFALASPAAARTAASARTATPGTAGLHAPAPGHCARQGAISVPRAQVQKTACLTDLTTAGTVTSGHTVPADYKGLASAKTRNPSGVPGIQVDGYFPDTSTTNTNNGWNHDSQFVMRFPDSWNGKLVVTGAPGVRRQYALDETISDWVLARGYAFAATDKGNTGTEFYRDGKRPGDAVVEWNRRVTQLTRAAKVAVKQRYGHKPQRTYMTGLSNGGYLTRWQLENHQELYDGGVDWEGTLFRAKGPNLLTYLPTALREYPKYKAGDSTAYDRMIAAGFSPGSEFLWDLHYTYYWDLTQRIYREEFDPSYDGDTQAGYPYCTPGSRPGCDADYDYASRPQAVKDAVRRVQLTGKIKRPMITLHGDLDALLPKETDSDVYAELIAAKHRSRLHRYYVIEGGNHVDSFVDLFPTKLRPILPCYRDAFTQLEDWVEDRVAPPPSGVVERRPGTDEANRCSVG